MSKYKLTIGDQTYDVEVEPKRGGGFSVRVNGNEYSVEHDPPKSNEPTRTLKKSPPSVKQARESSSKVVSSVLPGRVVSIKVKPGQQVSQGDIILVIESMKMQNDIAAPRTAKIQKVLVAIGDAVAKGQALVELD